MEDYIDILADLETQASNPMLENKVTSDRLLNLINSYVVGGEDVREFISETISGKKAGLILMYGATELAEDAITYKDGKYIKAALIAHAIEGFKWDARENLREFIFIAYASQKINFDIKSIKDDVLTFATNYAKKYLEPFFDKELLTINLNEHGFKLQKVNGKYKFISTEK